MRALRWGLVVLVLLAGAGGVVAWWGPGWPDWGTYRSDIAAFASARLGRQVEIDGPISLRLLPAPELTAAGITVRAASDGVAVTAQQLHMRVGLAALLAGRVEARELVLRGARVRVPWPFHPTTMVPAEGFSASEVRIEDGTLDVGGLTFTAIDGRVTTDAWTGSYAASGTMRFAGRPLHVSARLSRAGGDGSAGLEVALDGQGSVQGLGAALSGAIGVDGDFAGHLDVRGPDLAQLFPAPPLAFVADGRLSVANGRATLEGLSGQIGGASLQGHLGLALQPGLRLEGALSTSRLDLDAWRTALAGVSGARLPLALDLRAEATTFRGGMIRGLHLGIDIGPEGGALHLVRAILPGEAALNAEGRLVPVAGGWRFTGETHWTAPSLRTTLAWLGVGGKGLPEGVLHASQGTAQVVLAPGQVALDALDGVLDGTRLGGSVGLGFGAAVPVLTARLSAQRLDLDGWWPVAWPAGGMPAWMAGMQGDLSLDATDLSLHGMPLGEVSLQARTAAGQLQVQHLAWTLPDLRVTASGNLGGDGRLSDARVDVQVAQLSALPGPVTGLLPPELLPALRAWPGPASLSAQLEGPPGALQAKLTAETGDFHLDAEPVLDLPNRRLAGPLLLRDPGARRLAESLGLPALGDWMGDGSFAVVAQTQMDLSPQGTVSVGLPSFDIAAGALRAHGALRLQTGGAAPELTGQVFAETLPLPAPGWRSTEPLPFLAALRGWTARLHGEAAQALVGMDPVADRLAAEITLQDGRLALDSLRVGISGGSFTGRAALDVTGARPHAELAGQLQGVTLTQPLAGLPVDLTAGTLSGSVTLAAEGYAPATLLATAQGEAHFVAEGATLAGVGLDNLPVGAPEAQVRAALRGGSTAPVRLDLALAVARGVVTVTSGTLEEGTGEGPASQAPSPHVAPLQGTVSGLADLVGRTVNLHLELRPAWPEPPRLGVRLTGTFGAPVRTLEMEDLPLWRGAHPVSVPHAPAVPSPADLPMPPQLPASQPEPPLPPPPLPPPLPAVQHPRQP